MLFYMKRVLLVGLFLVIALVGLNLRYIDYDLVPPFAETNDEFFYPWAGMTWIRTGNPVAWSWFPAYPTRSVVVKWGINFPMVSPWLEKPPLYTLIMGTWMVINQVPDLFDVRLSLVRQIPVVLSLFTVLFTGILATYVFSKKVGIVAAILYATTPTLVLANRLSLTENLLTPLVLLTFIFFLQQPKKRYEHWLQPICVGICASLVVMTKNIGVMAGVAVFGWYLLQKKYWSALLVGLLVSIGIAWLYDWDLYRRVMADYQHDFANSGLPQLIATIFLYPVVGPKNHPILDGSMLLGYLLFFTSPLWLLQKTITPEFVSIREKIKSFFYRTSFVTPIQWKEKVLLSFPFGYITLLALLASGDKFSFYGWHVYPLFPFLIILVAKVLLDVWQSPQLLPLLTLTLILGSSAVRFVFATLPREVLYRWQYVLIAVFVLVLGTLVLPRRVKRWALLGLFACFIGVNIYASIHLRSFFPMMEQPWR